MNITLPTIPLAYLHIVLWVVAIVLLWLYLRKELTPSMVLSIFETEGVLSARQILAWIVALFGLFMRAAGRLDNDGLETCLEWAVFLFGIGGLKQVAAKLSPAPTVKAEKVEANVDTDTVNFSQS